MSRRRGRVGKWPLFVIAAPAGVAVWSGWVGLGQLTGFGEVHPLPGIADDFTINSAITLPVGVEAYAAYAMRVWFAGSAIPHAARTFAKVSAIMSLGVGIAGQVAYHLMEASGVTRAPSLVTMLVACLPVVTFGMAMALAHLLNSDDEPATAAEPVTTVDTAAPSNEATNAIVDPVIATPAAMVDTAVGDSVFEQLTPESRHGEDEARQPRRTSGNAALVRRAATANPGMSITGLATLTGVSRSTVRKYLPENATDDTATDEMAPAPVNGHPVPELLATV